MVGIGVVRELDRLIVVSTSGTKFTGTAIL